MAIYSTKEIAAVNCKSADIASHGLFSSSWELFFSWLHLLKSKTYWVILYSVFYFGIQIYPVYVFSCYNSSHVSCYVQSHCVLTRFVLRDSQQCIGEHSKFGRFYNRRLRHHCSCVCTHLLTSATPAQCYLQYVYIMVILLILYMIVHKCSVLNLTATWPQE